MADLEYLAWLKRGGVNVLARARHALAPAAAYVYVWGRTWIAEWQVWEDMRHTGQRVMARLYSTPWQELARRYQLLLALFVGIVVLLLPFAIWKLPQWYAASWEGLIEPKDIAGGREPKA